ncbi:radical SAM protein [Nannocystis sp.]|uniref:radical SAM protein n=1 Tax=Nannocystis sp. TaxID=1962667 RepID=UPI0025E26F9D|nr:radical SAM protein [Nannocystis sp.]MBK7828730.1 radical SAM protein [Nannocystis sp.]
MGLLHRLYARAAPEVWETETRLLHALRLVRRPVAVQWIVTSACDLHCPHCYSSAGKRTPGELSTEEAKRLIVDELVALGRPTLVLAGGELLLRRDIPEIIAYACEQGLEWAMHTHGGHVPKFRSLLARHPPSLAAISLDGERAQHDLFRGKVGSFDAALAAIRVLKETGCREVVAGTTVTRQSADRVADMFPVVAASGADSWGLHLFAPEGRGAEHMALFPTPEQLRRVAAFARRKRAVFHVELCNEWGSAGADDRYYRDQPFLCGAGRISCVIGASGEVLPCTTTDLGESEGNLRERPLRDIWARGFTRFRQRGQGVCSDGKECWLQSRNGNGCREQAFGGGARRAG